MEPNDEQASEVRAAISIERLAPYDMACDGDTVAALRLYAWNAEVAAAFWGPLHCLEVVMRNAMHRELAARFGRPDWWSSPALGLHPFADRRVRELLDRHQVGVGPDRIVADLEFGFWVSLLGRGNDYEMRLWRPALHRAFPGYRGPRATLSDQMGSVRLFRNRIAHHEPIYYRHLEADHAKILRFIEVVSPATAGWARRCDRVPAVLAKRAAVCSGRIPASF